MSVNKGFTLIEILVVIVIIGITLGFAMIAFGDFGRSKSTLFAVEQFKNMVALAQQQAIIEQSTLGIKIDATSYQLLKFKDNQQWGAISSNSLFKTRYFPNNTVVTLKTLHKNAKQDPAIIINSSGETSPFTMTFYNEKEKNTLTLSAEENGELTFNKATDDTHQQKH